MYIVDTNILSVSAPGRTEITDDIRNWLREHSAALFLSVVSVAEMQDGISKARRLGATAKAARLAGWMERLLRFYSGRILDFDLECARLTGTLLDLARGKGHAPGWADVMIAATAQHHGLAVLTRNVRHFAPLGVQVVDPFAALP